MNTELTTADKRRKFWWELKDLLAGAAFPLMIMLIFCVTITSYAGYGEELGIAVLCVVVGEILLIAAYVIFGKQNGTTAYRRYILNSKKRELGSADEKARLYTGEYAVYKGILIGFLSCLPYIIFQFIECVAPNTVCEFVLSYCFGWAYYPFSFAGLSQWLNLLLVIPLVGIHLAAYVWGKKQEEKKQQIIAEAQTKGKKKK